MKGFFDDLEWWKSEWKGMPEFIQEEQAPYKTIKVHFTSEDDIEEFAQLVGQNVTKNTQYIWFPRQEKENLKRMTCVDNDES